MWNLVAVLALPHAVLFILFFYLFYRSRLSLVFWWACGHVSIVNYALILCFFLVFLCGLFVFFIVFCVGSRGQLLIINFCYGLPICCHSVVSVVVHEIFGVCSGPSLLQNACCTLLSILQCS